MDIRIVPEITSASLRHDKEEDLYTLSIVTAGGDIFLEDMECSDVERLARALKDFTEG